MYLWLPPGEYECCPEGKEDNTHLSESGAREVAQMVAKEIVRMDMPLKEWVTLH